MNKIFIVGAGQLGSRHLQALKSIDIPLDITVIDPSEASLKIAQERYEGITGVQTHHVRYLRGIPESFDQIDIAIVPSNSNVRRTIVQTLLRNGTVRYLILEKLLFTRKEDYADVQDLLDRKQVTAWVNCSMRTMPFYAGLRDLLGSDPFVYTVTGSQFGLITNAIHYFDHVAYLAGDTDYTLITDMLDAVPIESKRKGFLELNGTLAAFFSRGSRGIVTCHPAGSLPVTVEIMSPNMRIISREWEGKAWISKQQNNWAWIEVPAPIPYQSQMTATVVKDILNTGTCALVPYRDSRILHETLLDGLQRFMLSKGVYQKDDYPFT